MTYNLCHAECLPSLRDWNSNSCDLSILIAISSSVEVFHKMTAQIQEVSVVRGLNRVIVVYKHNPISTGKRRLA